MSEIVIRTHHINAELLEEFEELQEVDQWVEAKIDVDTAESLVGVQDFIRKNQQAASFLGYRPQGFSVQAVFCDVDSTLIEQESLELVADRLNIRPMMAKLTTQAMEGKIAFSSTFMERLTFLKGLKKSELLEVADEVKIREGAKEFFELCHSKGIPTYLVSSGFTHIVQKVAESLNVTGYLANELEFDQDQLFTGKLVGEFVSKRKKAEFLLATCESHQIDRCSSVAFGDGANDEHFFKVSGLALGQQPKNVVVPFIHAFNNSNAFSPWTSFLFP